MFSERYTMSKSKPWCTRLIFLDLLRKIDSEGEAQGEGGRSKLAGVGGGGGRARASKMREKGI